LGFVVRFLLRRLAQGVVIMLLVSMAIFTILRWDDSKKDTPARLILGPMATQDSIDRKTEELGFNDPIPVQYAQYILNVFRGDLGTSYIRAESGMSLGATQDDIQTQRASVSRLMLASLPMTLQLAALALIIAMLIAVPIGVAGGLNQGRWPDRLAVYLSSIFVSLPNFWLGIVLAFLLTAKLGWLPSLGYKSFSYTILPATVIAVEMAPLFIRSFSVSIAATVRQNFIALAYVRGIPPRTIFLRNVLRNIAVPNLNLFGVQIGAMLGGVLIVEYIFDYPGFGLLTVQAVSQRDYPVIQGISIISSAIFVIANMLVDLVSAKIDPRVEL
jgi:ABC-type dipeptide/oligopeptide/nickel transport system permease component